MQAKALKRGAYPAMITPYTADNKIDYPAVERLLRWYEKENCAGVLAICASSEIELLSLEERIELAHFCVEHKGNLTMVVCGHCSDDFEEQVIEMNAMAAAKPDALCFIVSHVNEPGLDDDGFIANTKRLMDAIEDKEIPLGFYEWPGGGERRRFLNEKILKWCADTGRFVFVKETSCQSAAIKAKIDAVKGTNLGIYNANSSLLYQSLLDGAAGFCGIMANYHGYPYQWLCDNFEKHPKEAALVSDLIGALSQTTSGYPASAKLYQKKYGAYMEPYSRRFKLNMSEEDEYRLGQVHNVVTYLREKLEELDK